MKPPLWDDETEARFQAWEKAPERPWNRLPQAMETLSLPSEPEAQPVSKMWGRGRPMIPLESVVLQGEGSLREKGRQLGVSAMTIWRRIKGGMT